MKSIIFFALLGAALASPLSIRLVVDDSEGGAAPEAAAPAGVAQTRTLDAPAADAAPADAAAAEPDNRLLQQFFSMSEKLPVDCNLKTAEGEEACQECRIKLSVSLVYGEAIMTQCAAVITVELLFMGTSMHTEVIDLSPQAEAHQDAIGNIIDKDWCAREQNVALNGMLENLPLPSFLKNAVTEFDACFGVYKFSCAPEGSSVDLKASFKVPGFPPFEQVNTVNFAAPPNVQFLCPAGADGTAGATGAAASPEVTTLADESEQLTQRLNANFLQDVPLDCNVIEQNGKKCQDCHLRVDMWKLNAEAIVTQCEAVITIKMLFMQTLMHTEVIDLSAEATAHQEAIDGVINKQWCARQQNELLNKQIQKLPALFQGIAGEIDACVGIHNFVCTPTASSLDIKASISMPGFPFEQTNTIDFTAPETLTFLCPGGESAAAPAADAAAAPAADAAAAPAADAAASAAAPAA